MTVGDPDAPDAVAPLVRRERRLELAGARELQEPGDLLARTPEALAELSARLVAGGWPLYFDRVPADSPTMGALKAAIGRRGAMVVRETEGFPSLALTPEWQEPGGGLSRRRRADLRRARRRAGELAVERHAPAPGEVGPLLEAALDVEARSWKGREGTALRHDPARAAFFRRYADAAASRGTLRIELLRLGGVPAAMQIALEWRERVWLLKIGYDEAHAAASPGLLLLAESIADAARRGLAAYELLGVAADWTAPWTTEVRGCVTVAAYPAGRRALPAASRAAARVARARLRRAAGAGLNRTVALAARRYVTGPALTDALPVAEECGRRGHGVTLGYWNADDDPPARVRDEALAALAALAPRSLDGELSIKPPALGNDRTVIAELLDRALAAGVGLHFDALAPDEAQRALDIAVALGERAGGRLGCTLPGRWERSLADADAVVGAGLRVRVVKSEWADPAQPDRDPRDGFLEVVGALAGRAAHVAVATHDATLATAALARLRGAGTPCELQVLYGMRAAAAVDCARRAGVPLRVYVPYGRSRIPYPLDGLRRRPDLVARVAADVVLRRSPTVPPA